MTFPRTVLCALVVAALLLVACGGGSAPAPTGTPAPSATAPAVDLGPAQPEAERVLDHVRVLAGDIGIRPSGSEASERAIDYASRQLGSYGYHVELQDFVASGPGVLRLTAVEVTQPASEGLAAIAFTGAASGAVSGPLVDAANGNAEEFPAEAAGAVALVQRKDVPFAEMASNAEAAGAIALIVANKEEGIFRGEIDPATDLPAVAIGLSDGDGLRALLAQGPVEVAIDVQAEVHASNVVARPVSGRCRTLVGGHLDSVPWAPGAVDNASGSALVLELARASAAAGDGDRCFVLFGAEEIGLKGSEQFVQALSKGERDGIEAMINLDVVASNAAPLLLGSSDLLDEAEALAAELGVDAQRGTLPRDVSSDHLSFLDAGVSALLITTPDFTRIHTPEDTVANLEPVYLQGIADLAFALLGARSAAPTATPVLP